VVPSEEMKRLHSELEDVFAELWHGPRFGIQRRGFRPNIDVLRTEEPDELRVMVDLAGVDPEDVHVVVNERALVIAGRRRHLHPDRRLSYHLLEIERGQFERRLALPVDVDPGRARATYDRGLLVITLPVAAKPPRGGRILIRVQTSA
jgi:HSP20 family molecular chaperone IbpA